MEIYSLKLGVNTAQPLNRASDAAPLSSRQVCLGKCCSRGLQLSLSHSLQQTPCSTMQVALVLVPHAGV